MARSIRISGVVVILLTLCCLLVYRLLTSAHTGNGQPKVSVPAVMQESLILGSLLIQ